MTLLQCNEVKKDFDLLDFFKPSPAAKKTREQRKQERLRKKAERKKKRQVKKNKN